MPRFASLLCTVGAVALFAAPLCADEKDSLASLAWCVGGKWVHEVPDADKPITIETTFEWAGHKKAIRYTITFTAGGKTTTQYEGTYWYHPGKQSLVMLQIDRLGNVTESTVTPDATGFKQTNTVSAVDGAKREQRVEVVRDGDDAFTFRAKVPKDGDWVEAVTFAYKRVPAAK
jgi:hypothetical protein